MGTKKTAAVVGILCIIGTVSGILSGVVSAPLIASSSYLLSISAHGTHWIIGTLFVMLMGLSLTMIPVMLYPVFSTHNKVLALGAVLFRGAIEAISYAIMVVSMLLRLTVGEIYGRGTAADAAVLQTVGSLLTATKDWTEMWGAIVFGIGGLMIYILFYQTRLVPRWLYGWGLVGGGLYITANLVSMASPLHTAPSIGSGFGLLMIPTAIQEMVFAAWLIVKGFDRTAVATLPGYTSRREAEGQLISGLPPA